MAHLNRKNKDACVNNLRDLFGNVLHIDIIRSVASHCDFDVHKSSNALLEMTHHNSIGGHSLKKKKNVNTTQKPKKSLSPHNSPMKKVEQIGLGHTTKSKKSLEVERVIKNIQEGYKVLVLLRGLPGSGKSHLAKTITDVTLGPGDNSHHILSADDYFNQAGRYLYDSKRVSDAHEWNQHRAFQAMSRGLSPVLIDNTNIKMWEMKPYAMMATDYGYLIEILEPDTCWAFNDKELAKKNIHGVPKSTIKEKLEMYDKNITSQKLLVAYNLSYKFQKPPQYRLFPPIIRNNFLNCNLPLRIQHNGLRSTSQIEGGGVPKSKSTPSIFEQRSNVHEAENINLMDFTDNSEVSTKQYAVDVKSENYVNPVDEILMYCENSNTEVLQPKQISDKNILFPDIENAWGIDQKALQSWDIVTPIKSPSPSPNLHLLNIDKNPTETTDGWSNIDGSDFWQEGVDHPPTGSKVLQARSRDINIDSPARILSIPKKTMIDQSSLTDDVMDEESDENRIKDLLDLFPKVSKSSLIELFNRCNKNFNWTVDLLLEDENLEVTSSVDLVEETIEVVDSAEEAMEDAVPIPSESSKNDNVIKRKPLSEDALELKKCLEKKIDINKEHYSDHVLKVKQYKFGGYSEQVAQTSTSAAAASTREFTIDLESDIDSDDSDHVDDDPKNMIELNLGESFVEQLETMFGTDSVFPKGYQPVVQMPRTLARQIYSFYVESVCQQMEAQNHILDRLIKEDEEFARKLQVQDVPLKPPNLLEIMDEQVASKIHKRNVDEWKNMTADNLAAKLTKQKLLKAFPEVEQDSLLEIWHAYDYDYKKTVEDLMASIGPTQMKSSLESIQEPPLSTFTLEEMKEAEGNCLTVEEFEEGKPATYFRDKANMHLRRREELYKKAQGYYQKGMTEVAFFYSDLAQKETLSFDRANHIAATVFAEEHSKRLQKFDTIDLHYLYVKEAIPQLDIFLDRNIHLLKGGSKRGQDLFVITGRGKNSIGGKCKIKPAVIARLSRRNIGFVQLNPGLLKIRVMWNSPMTSDLH